MSDKVSRSGPTSNQSGVKMIRDVLIVAIVLAGGFYWYYNKTENSKAANKTAAEAKNLLLRDNPADYAEAEAKLREVLEKYDSSHGYSIAALAELEAILWGENHLSERKAAAEEFVAKAMKANPGIAEQYAAKALLMTFDGDAAGAEAFLRTEVIEKGGGGPRILAAFGQAQRAQGKLEDARRAFKLAIDADWRNARFAQLIGESYLEEGDGANALAYFQKGLAANSDHYGCQLGAARARLMRNEQIKEATDAIERALKATDLTPALKARALVAQAELRLYEQKVDEAIASATEAAQADPAFAWAYAVKARALALKGDAQAVADFDKAIAADEWVAAFYFDAAVALASTGDSDRAVTYLDKYPLKKDDQYYLKYGHVLRALGKLDEAIAKYDKAIEENQTNADAYLAKGSILVAQGASESAAAEKQKKFEEAQKVLETALIAREFNPPVHVQIAEIHFQKKEWADGLQAYAKALTQWRTQKMPREELTAKIEEVKQRLLAARERNYAQVWESEATNLIR
ncbi:MAG TPA: tetratricopeptide repeat protein [Vulgatibacter sp.]|nr:tetratricopeptide repeat protein [Vulgatibacter sp.]